jgi:hypothetical protein
MDPLVTQPSALRELVPASAFRAPSPAAMLGTGSALSVWPLDVDPSARFRAAWPSTTGRGEHMAMTDVREKLRKKSKKFREEGVDAHVG